MLVPRLQHMTNLPFALVLMSCAPLKPELHLKWNTSETKPVKVIM